MFAVPVHLENQSFDFQGQSFVLGEPFIPRVATVKELAGSLALAQRMKDASNPALIHDIDNIRSGGLELKYDADLLELFHAQSAESRRFPVLDFPPSRRLPVPPIVGTIEHLAQRTSRSFFTLTQEDGTESRFSLDEKRRASSRLFHIFYLLQKA